MMRRSSKRSFAIRRSPPTDWIREAGTPSPRAVDVSIFTARLTIGVTPELRGRIKIAAFQRGATVAEMLRELLALEFPANSGELS